MTMGTDGQAPGLAPTRTEGERTGWWWRVAAVCAATVLLLAACSGDDGDGAEEAMSDAIDEDFVLDPMGRTGITAGGEDTVTVSATPPPVGWEDNMLAQVNALRAQHGVAALSLCATLTAASQAHSDDQRNGNFMDHTGSDGSTPVQRAAAAGYGTNVTVGENVAAGFGTVDGVMAGWIASPPHFQTLIHPSLQHIGLSVAVRDDGHRFFWTQKFGGGGSCEPGGATGTPPDTQPQSTPTPTPAPDPDAPFADVPSTHPFVGAVRWMADNGISTGFADNTFRPTAPVTRQAMASFLWQIQGAPEGPFPDPGLADVPPGHPFHTPIAWMVDSGLATGFDDGNFRPTADVSRQATAAFLWRIEGQPGAPSPDFTDVPPTHPFAAAIGWATAAGVTGGFDDGTFRPANPVSRQAAAAFLQRWHDPQSVE
ncbi:MAG: S-layer homology domain-containing protein [Acidimicrobiia bacterium]|nr:S-layer homology domain-containing protein [Acidimicrobiia bacterium]